MNRIKAMKIFFLTLIFIFGTVKLTSSTVCEPCDPSKCNYGIEDTLDENGCPSCECVICDSCECPFGFTEYLDNNCPDCNSCLEGPTESCSEINCHLERGPCVERQNCCPNTCKQQALCSNKEVNLVLCTVFCPSCFLQACQTAASCVDLCPAVLNFTFCDQCQEDHHCELGNNICPASELCELEAYCVPNSCRYPVQCALSCPHGLLRDERNCSVCECRRPTCDEMVCTDGYKCVDFTSRSNFSQCVPADCTTAYCGQDFTCEEIDGMPKCLKMSCEKMKCPGDYQCTNNPDCETGSCLTCTPKSDCSNVKCGEGETCEVITPDCPECECGEGSAPDCIVNNPGCDSMCLKPHAQCITDCKEVDCPKNCKYGCLKTPDGCSTDTCAPPNDCDDVKCSRGEVCELVVPDCDSDIACPEMEAICKKYCPRLNCTQSHEKCPWGMKKDSNDCPICDCNEPYSCDQIKCHVDDRCVIDGNQVTCLPCEKTGRQNCSQGEEYVIDEFGCVTGRCAPMDVCEEVNCPLGQECVIQNSTCDRSQGDCSPWTPKCVCNTMDCHKFCEHGFKKNLLTGCEMCECNDDLPTCDDIKCPPGKTCTMVPSCMDVNCPLPKPVCQDCPSLELCPTCAFGQKREVDKKGCQICKCKSICSDPLCDLTCGFLGNKLDEEGCPTCKCNDFTPCQVKKIVLIHQ